MISTERSDWSSFADDARGVVVSDGSEAIIARAEMTLLNAAGVVTPAALHRYHTAEMTDATCVRAALDGDDTAFATLVDRHAPVCLRFATRMLGSREDAEDATQETFLRAHRALARFDDAMSFRTWVMSILINRCRTTLLARKRRTARIVVDEAAVERAHVDATANETELRDAIDRAVARLDPTQREAFLLKHVELLSYEEMAEMTGAGISALKMRVQRACERLQVLLKEDLHA
jgi:RNA polymerase sigma-70 factor (ECF subfamily)